MLSMGQVTYPNSSYHRRCGGGGDSGLGRPRSGWVAAAALQGGRLGFYLLDSGAPPFFCASFWSGSRLAATGQRTMRAAAGRVTVGRADAAEMECQSPHRGWNSPASTTFLVRVNSRRVVSQPAKCKHWFKFGAARPHCLRQQNWPGIENDICVAIFHRRLKVEALNP